MRAYVDAHERVLLDRFQGDRGLAARHVLNMSLACVQAIIPEDGCVENVAPWWGDPHRQYMFFTFVAQAFASSLGPCVPKERMLPFSRWASESITGAAMQDAMHPIDGFSRCDPARTGRNRARWGALMRSRARRTGSRSWMRCTLRARSVMRKQCAKRRWPPSNTRGHIREAARPGTRPLGRAPDTDDIHVRNGASYSGLVSGTLCELHERKPDLT